MGGGQVIGQVMGGGGAMGAALGEGQRPDWGSRLGGSPNACSLPVDWSTLCNTQLTLHRFTLRLY